MCFISGKHYLLSVAALYMYLCILVQHLMRPGRLYKVLSLRLLGGEVRGMSGSNTEVQHMMCHLGPMTMIRPDYA
jgi:hypothetical protein